MLNSKNIIQNILIEDILKNNQEVNFNIFSPDLPKDPEVNRANGFLLRILHKILIYK